MKKAGRGSGFGKVILFGEHFVVYGLPAIASAISDVTLARIEPSERFGLIDDRPATPDYKETKKGEMDRSLKLIFDFMKLDAEKSSMMITLSGNLYCTSGIGASAAMATSIARALSDYYGLNLGDEQINRISYEGEKGSAGTPSGIDNTCATFGGLLWFRKNLDGGPNTIELIKIKKPIEIVLGNTGISAVTGEVVADVRKAKEADPAKFERIFRDYENIVKEARTALEKYDTVKLGELMDLNQELLRQIGVSCPQSERIIKIAKENGALGAKITGTGRGGYVIALTPGRALQDKAAKAIKKAGFEAMKTSIGESQ